MKGEQVVVWWGLWGIGSVVSVLALAGGARGLYRLRALAQDARNESETVLTEWGEPAVTVAAEDPSSWTAGSAQYLALPGPPPPSFAELAGPQQPQAPMVGPETAAGGGQVTMGPLRPPPAWADKTVAIRIIDSVRAPVVTDYELVLMPKVDELGVWERGDAELVPALILNKLLDEREGVS